MTGHWHCRLIEFVLRAFRPYRGLFNFAWGGQPIMRDELRRLLVWLPTKTIIAALRGHQQRVDRQDNADLDYLGTRYNLHYSKQWDRGKSAQGIGLQIWSASIRNTRETQLIAYTGLLTSSLIRYQVIGLICN